MPVGARMADPSYKAIVEVLWPALECLYVPIARAAGNWHCETGQNKMSSAVNKATETQRKGDFEKSLARLEEVVKRLESPDLSLDDAMKLFEEGVRLSRECQKQLEEAEGRVEILLKKADGKIAAEPFEPQDESS